MYIKPNITNLLKMYHNGNARIICISINNELFKARGKRFNIEMFLFNSLQVFRR